MRNIILFFIKNNAFFLFAFLEFISIYLVVHQNQEQSAIFANTSHLFSSKVERSQNSILQYYYAYSDNIKLNEEKSSLKHQIDSLQYILNGMNEGRKDSLANTYASSFEYIPAAVINNSTNLSNNYISLDKGSKDGFEPNMGLVSDQGIVGITRHVSENYSLAMSLLHRDIRISAQLKKNGYHGALVWKENDARYMYLEAIPKHVRINKTDTITTTGFSTHFPEGYMIGTVHDKKIEAGSNFYTIQVSLQNDLNTIRYVLGVLRKNRDELLELQEQIMNE